MLKYISAFLDACYIIRQSDINEYTLKAFDNALKRFHTHRKNFRTSGVRPTGFGLPRQHSSVHYQYLTEQFGAPNGLCSSITESRHITAIKKPWRRSNRYKALGQMLTTNRRSDKLTAARADFVDWKMLPPAYAPPPKPKIPPAPDNDDNAGPVDGLVDGSVVLACT